MRAYARPGDSAVVVGGGLLGLEAAKVLCDLGLHVTVVHVARVLMNAQLDAIGGEMLERRSSAAASSCAPARTVEAVCGEERVEGVCASTTAACCRPTWWCWRAACGRASTWRARPTLPINKGIIVNDTLATEVPGVYAVGECAEHRGRLYGIVTPVWEQAAVLADVLSGREPAGALPRLEAVHAAQGGRRRRRVDGRDRARARQRRGDPGHRGAARARTAS